MAGQTSIENGKKGGRPKGSKATHTLDIIEAKKYVTERIIRELKPLIDVQLKKAKQGDFRAFEELMKRGIGRVREDIDVSALPPLNITIKKYED